MRSRLTLGLALTLALTAAPAAPAWAGPQVFSWDVVSLATSYGVEQSADGATWTAAAATVPTCTADRCTTTVTAPATGLVLYRVWAADGAGRATRFNAGVWICESCVPPPPAVNLGVR